MSLRDQLLKAGLVSQDKAQQTEAEHRKKKHRAKKDKGAAAEESAEKARLEAERRAEEEAKRQRDRELNQARETEKAERAKKAQLKQLLAAHRCNRKDAECRYNFTDDRWVRSLRVSDQQSTELAKGRLAIVRNPELSWDYALLPREAALKVQALDPSAVVVLHADHPGVDEA